MQEKMTYTVVVADDEDELREALCRMVPWEELGFRLVGDASNGLMRWNWWNSWNRISF